MKEDSQLTLIDPYQEMGKLLKLDQARFVNAFDWAWTAEKMAPTGFSFRSCACNSQIAPEEQRKTPAPQNIAGLCYFVYPILGHISFQSKIIFKTHFHALAKIAQCKF